MTYNAIIQTPLSNIGFITYNDKLQTVQFVSQKPIAPKTTFDKHVARQLTQYFKCAAMQFDLPLQLIGTPFQKRVWRALQQIKPGETNFQHYICQKPIKNPRTLYSTGL